ncbi:MAG: cofactor-independent phosphoglycerate mutase [Phycisphaerae bacterium]|nr:cofactor-independent phosphoglycerate mutase [Phycisphaerae bacterium]
MKSAIIIMDGAADLPLDELEGKTPLQAANIPNCNRLARSGKVGTTRNIPKGMPLGSDVAILSVLGYDPKKNYPGRAPLEAAAQGIELGPNDWVFRCNFVTVIDGVMEDYSAGHISSAEAKALIDELARQLGGAKVQFFPGVSYRHLVVFRDCREPMSATTVPPHDLLAQPIAGSEPRGPGSDVLKTLMNRATDVLANHEINRVRRDLGENPATAIWLWGQGQQPQLTSFQERFGVRGCAITAVDLVRGIAKLIGWPVIEVPGATGYLDTNYAGKGAAAIEALDHYDLVLVHVEAPDEAGHNANVRGKIEAIEAIDANIVGPLADKLASFQTSGWRILVLPDHPTPIRTRSHTDEPVPWLLAGSGIAAVISLPFDEASAARSDLNISRGCDLMEYFLKER